VSEKKSSRVLLPVPLVVVLAFLCAVRPCWAAEGLEGEEPEPVRVSHIEISTRYESPAPETYRPLIPLEAGREISRPQRHFVRKLLEQTGLFRSVEMEEAPDPEGTRLLFHLWQAEKVRAISIKGNLYVLDSAIYRVLEMQEDDLFHPQALPEELERIRNLYVSKGWFGAEVRCVRQDNPTTGSVDLSYRIRRGKLLRFRRVELEGVQAGDPEILRDLFQIRPLLTGGRLRRRTQKAVRYYQSLGYPSVKIRVEPDPFPEDGGEPRLVVVVQEGKRLELSLEGNRALSRRKIEKALTFNKEGGVSFFDAEDSAKAVRILYQGHGFPLASVTFQRKESPDQVNVHLSIQEGPRAFIDRIVFTGDPSIPARRLRKQMLTRPRNLLLFRRGLYRSERWDRDLGSLQGLFLSSGYLNAILRPELEPHPDKPHRLRLNVHVDPGPRFTVGEVTWEGMDPAWTARVVQEARVSSQDDFNPVFQAQEAQRAARFLAEQGFLLARVDPSHRFTQDDRVDLLFRVRQGPLFRATGIVVAGNEEIKTRTVRKAIRLRAGDTIRNDRLVRARDRLFKLRLFEGLSVSVPGLNLPEGLPEGADAPEVLRPVLIKVKEQKTLEMEMGGRYDSDTGFEGFLTLQENNLFHRAQRLNLDGLVGEIKWEGSLAYTVPTLLGYRLTGTVEGRHKQETYEAFNRQDTFGSATLRRTLREMFTTSVSFGVKRSDVFGVKSVGPDAPLPASTTNLFFEPRVQLDTRDDRIYPSKGFFLNVGVAVSGRQWGSTDNLVVTSARVSGYHSFRPNWTLAATLSADFVEPYGNTRQAPSTELLFAGGNESVRGFPRQRLGPVDVFGTPLGGTTRVLGSVEMRFPIYRLLHGYVFVDTGSLTRGWEQVTGRTFRWTSGAGIRLYTPVGPLCLGYGHQLQPNPPLDRGQILFSLGFPF